MGIALVDVGKLNSNGVDHEYELEGIRSLLWQPVWMDVSLSGDGEITAAEQAAKAAKVRLEREENDKKVREEFKIE